MPYNTGRRHPEQANRKQSGTLLENIHSHGPPALWVLLIVAVVIGTTFFSSQNGPESDGISQRLAVWLLSVLSLPTTGETLLRWNHVLRKAAHFSLYFCLGVGLTGLLCRQRRVPRLSSALLLSVLYASLDEGHQRFSPGRAGNPADVLLDTCGAACGFVLTLLVFFLIDKTRRRSGGSAHR